MIDAALPSQLPNDLTFSSSVIRLSLVLILVLLNAFFVAAEFALVAVRRSRIDQMAAEGDRSEIGRASCRERVSPRV